MRPRYARSPDRRPSFHHIKRALSPLSSTVPRQSNPLLVRRASTRCTVTWPPSPTGIEMRVTVFAGGAALGRAGASAPMFSAYSATAADWARTRSMPTNSDDVRARFIISSWAGERATLGSRLKRWLQSSGRRVILLPTSLSCRPRRFRCEVGTVQSSDASPSFEPFAVPEMLFRSQWARDLCSRSYEMIICSVGLGLTCGASPALEAMDEPNAERPMLANSHQARTS